jgi:hypothetical protein
MHSKTLKIIEKLLNIIIFNITKKIKYQRKKIFIFVITGLKATNAKNLYYAKYS